MLLWKQRGFVVKVRQEARDFLLKKLFKKIWKIWWHLLLWLVFNTGIIDVSTKYHIFQLGPTCWKYIVNCLVQFILSAHPPKMAFAHVQKFICCDLSQQTLLWACTLKTTTWLLGEPENSFTHRSGHLGRGATVFPYKEGAYKHLSKVCVISCENTTCFLVEICKIVSNFGKTEQQNDHSALHIANEGVVMWA